MRIALLGSAPSSIRLAPFKDPSWSVWACSPGAYPVIADDRQYHDGDAFFELHRWEAPVIGVAHLQKPWFSPEYCAWLAQFKGPVWVGGPVPELPTARLIPQKELIEKYGPYFFTSSLAWMLAMALETEGVTEIGLWGVDMSASEEYWYQRPGCQFFLQEAVKRGIKVTVPPESDLLQPMPLYGVGEWDPMMVKYTARQNELQSRLSAAHGALESAKQETLFLQGAMDNNKYWMNTWIGTHYVGSMLDLLPKAQVIPIKGVAD
jgi:hypothetical protein